MNFSQTDYSQIIIDTINKLFTNLFSSVDNTLYSLLDKIVFVDSSIIKDSFFDKAFGSGYNIGLIALANSLLIGFTIYYCSKLMLSTYTANNVEKPYQFILKAIIFGICVNCSQFLCEQIITINSFITDAIREIGKYIFGTSISFNNLISQMNSFINISSSFNLFSFDGIMKSFVSIGLLNLLFSYSLRYIMIKVFILLSPFAFLSLITQSTAWFFKTWIRNFISLLLIQPFISLIFLIIFSFDGTFSSVFSQLMYIGAIYALTKANHYMQELIGGISTDFNINLGSVKSFIK